MINNLPAVQIIIHKYFPVTGHLIFDPFNPTHILNSQTINQSKNQTNNQTPTQSNNQTIKQSNNQTIKQSNNQTIKQSNN